MTNRVSPELPATPVFIETEIELMDHLVPAEGANTEKTVGGYQTKLARLGGFLARKSDGHSGNMVLWRDMARLIDIYLGYSVGRDVGN